MFGGGKEHSKIFEGQFPNLDLFALPLGFVGQDFAGCVVEFAKIGQRVAFEAEIAEYAAPAVGSVIHRASCESKGLD